MKVTISTLLTVFTWSVTVACHCEITLDRNIIPSLPDYFPVVSVGSPVRFPLNTLRDIIHESAGASNTDLHETCDEFGHNYFSGERLVASWDKKTGETAVFPNYQSLRPATRRNISTEGIQRFFRDRRIFPVDDTTLSLTQGSTLFGSTHQNNSAPTTPTPYLANVRLDRTVHHAGQDYAVCGPASKATFSFGADGKLQSFSHIWSSAQRTNSTIKSLSGSEIYDSIIAQLEVSANASLIMVTHVDFCFYASGTSHLQPVLRYLATIQNTSNGTDQSILGFVPAGNDRVTRDTIAAMMPPQDQPQPGDETNARNISATATVIRRDVGGKPQINVGRYVYRNAAENETPMWNSEANDFWNGLSNTQNSVASFVNSQYYEAHSWQYMELANSRVNSVDVALTEAHGNWDYFATTENEGVSIAGTPASGYGPGSGGRLAYWVLKGCEIVPTSVDLATAYDPWWHVFNGLHAVVGFRTSSLFLDGATIVFANRIAKGLPVVSSWLDAVHGLGAYTPDHMYDDSHTTFDQPYGRPSAVHVCGHSEDRIIDTENLGLPECLQMWWYDS